MHVRPLNGSFSRFFSSHGSRRGSIFRKDSSQCGAEPPILGQSLFFKEAGFPLTLVTHYALSDIFIPLQKKLLAKVAGLATG